jgi:hypothetical protein
MPPLLTLFSAPKPFTDPHITLIQHNALSAWTRLEAQVEVLLVGEEAGLAEAAAAHGVRLLPDAALRRAGQRLERNEAGTPLVSSIFALARQASDAPFLAYTNADMLYLPDLLEAVQAAARLKERFLLVGRRWDLDLRQPLEELLGGLDNGWDARLRGEIARRGRLHAPAGSDYFVFPRSLYTEIPDFAIGRAGWDNWMIYYARSQGWPVIDATPSMLAVHQDHDYRHLPGGKPHYTLPESRQNEALAGGASNLYMILDSDYELAGGRLRPPSFSPARLLRQAETAFAPPGTPRRGWRWALARQFRRLRRRLTGTL